MPGTEADEIASLPAQLNMAADEIDDVDRLLDLFFGVERHAARHRYLPYGHVGEFHFASNVGQVSNLSRTLENLSYFLIRQIGNLSYSGQLHLPKPLFSTASRL